MIGNIPLQNNFQPSVVTSQPMAYSATCNMTPDHMPPPSYESCIGMNIKMLELLLSNCWLILLRARVFDWRDCLIHNYHSLTVELIDKIATVSSLYVDYGENPGD